jgi:hypothetical protein
MGAKGGRDPAKSASRALLDNINGYNVAESLAMLPFAPVHNFSSRKGENK